MKKKKNMEIYLMYSVWNQNVVFPIGNSMITRRPIFSNYTIFSYIFSFILDGTLRLQSLFLALASLWWMDKKKEEIAFMSAQMNAKKTYLIKTLNQLFGIIRFPLGNVSMQNHLNTKDIFIYIWNYYCSKMYPNAVHNMHKINES